MRDMVINVLICGLGLVVGSVLTAAVILTMRPDGMSDAELKRYLVEHDIALEAKVLATCPVPDPTEERIMGGQIVGLVADEKLNRCLMASLRAIKSSLEISTNGTLSDARSDLDNLSIVCAQIGEAAIPRIVTSFGRRP